MNTPNEKRLKKVKTYLDDANKEEFAKYDIYKPQIRN
jgi:hypothetical protein